MSKFEGRPLAAAGRLLLLHIAIEYLPVLFLIIVLKVCLYFVCCVMLGRPVAGELHADGQLRIVDGLREVC